MSAIIEGISNISGTTFEGVVFREVNMESIPDTASASAMEFPGVTLTVKPDGTWLLYDDTLNSTIASGRWLVPGATASDYEVAMGAAADDPEISRSSDEAFTVVTTNRVATGQSVHDPINPGSAELRLYSAARRVGDVELTSSNLCTVTLTWG